MLIHIHKYTPEPKSVTIGTRGSFGWETISFLFSEEWNGLDIELTFFPLFGAPITVPYHGGEAEIPREITDYSGTSKYVLVGTLTSDGKLKKRIVTYEGEIFVEYTADAEG